MKTMPKHISWPSIDSYSLYATGVTGGMVMFYAESVGVVTSGHVTKRALKLFDPPFPKTPCYTHTTRLSLL